MSFRFYFVLIITSARRCCDHASLSIRSLVGWLVGCLVRSLPSLSFLEKYNSVFHEIWNRCSVFVPTITINFLDIKVKVEGQNRRTGNLQMLLARPTIRQIFGYQKYSGGETGGEGGIRPRRHFPGGGILRGENMEF